MWHVQESNCSLGRRTVVEAHTSSATEIFTAHRFLLLPYGTENFLNIYLFFLFYITSAKSYWFKRNYIFFFKHEITLCTKTDCNCLINSKISVKLILHIGTYQKFNLSGLRVFDQILDQFSPKKVNMVDALMPLLLEPNKKQKNLKRNIHY